MDDNSIYNVKNDLTFSGKRKKNRRMIYYLMKELRQRDGVKKALSALKSKLDEIGIICSRVSLFCARFKAVLIQINF